VAGDPTFCAFASTLSGNELLPRLKLTCEAFHASGFEVETLMIDGDRATVIIDATFMFAPTGETGTFELCHLWTFKDGKAVELVEYADTARLADMHARAGNPRPL
jgi:ketosteroid isomerase-like protein